MRRPLLFKKKTEPEQASPFFRKKNDEQFFTANTDRSNAELEPGSDHVSSLSKETQSQMGAALGGDFSDVKIHTGPRAEKMNKSMNAYAFTYGKDIYFNKNMFNETSQQGKLLLAHELVHTMQQQPGKTDTGTANDEAIEKETDTMAEQAVDTATHDHSTKESKNNTMSSTGLKVQACGRAPAPGMTWVTVIPHSGLEPGGWKEATTVAGFMAQYPVPRNVTCRMRIGVPIRTFLGPVHDWQATDAAIAAMQAAGQELQAVLRSMDPLHVTPNDVICIEYRQLVETNLQLAIPGARVSLN